MSWGELGGGGGAWGTWVSLGELGGGGGAWGTWGTSLKRERFFSRSPGCRLASIAARWLLASAASGVQVATPLAAPAVSAAHATHTLNLPVLVAPCATSPLSAHAHAWSERVLLSCSFLLLLAPRAAHALLYGRRHCSESAQEDDRRLCKAELVIGAVLKIGHAALASLLACSSSFSHCGDPQPSVFRWPWVLLCVSQTLNDPHS